MQRRVYISARRMETMRYPCRMQWLSFRSEATSHIRQCRAVSRSPTAASLHAHVPVLRCVQNKITCNKLDACKTGSVITNRKVALYRHTSEKITSGPPATNHVDSSDCVTL